MADQLIVVEGSHRRNHLLRVHGQRDGDEFAHSGFASLAHVGVEGAHFRIHLVKQCGCGRGAVVHPANLDRHATSRR